MPDFPPGRTLIIPPSQLWSRAAFAASGASVAGYPASNVTDGSSARAARNYSGTDFYTITLSAPRTPTVFGVIHSNIATGNVCTFQSGGGLDRGAAARRPNFWLDLRGFPSTSSTWTFYCSGSPRPLMVGEIVIGTAFEFDGVVSTAPAEQTTFWQERLPMQYGQIALSAAKALQREIRLDLSMDAAEAAQLDQIAYEANLTGERVVVVPDSRRNDIWFVRWPKPHEMRFGKSAVAEITVSLSLVEQSAGAVL